MEGRAGKSVEYKQIANPGRVESGEFSLPTPRLRFSREEADYKPDGREGSPRHPSKVNATPPTKIADWHLLAL